MGKRIERGARWLLKTVYRQVRASCGAPVDPRAVNCALLEQRVQALAEGR